MVPLNMHVLGRAGAVTSMLSANIIERSQIGSRGWAVFGACNADDVVTRNKAPATGA
jgi:hypothetical protein